MTERSVKTKKPVLDVLQRKTPDRVPYWLMRQAGRYLPEYRELRAKAGGFLDMVYNPPLAAEITMQPIRRFGMDAAILFSDILVIPQALGQPLSFVAGEGPKLTPLLSEADFGKLDLGRVGTHCEPVCETVSLVREKLAQETEDDTTLIGFCGSPWTVVCYMIEGGGSRDFTSPRLWALRDPVSFQKLIDLVVEASVQYLSGQIRAGAEVVKLFDSWAGLLDGDQFSQWVIAPTRRLVSAIKTEFPHIPVIGFPKGAGGMSVAYARETGVDCIGIDHTVEPLWAAEHLCPLLPVQGNLDPVRLLAGDAALEDGLEKIHSSFSGKGFIFNLGHGVIKETPIGNVTRLNDIVRSWTL